MVMPERTELPISERDSSALCFLVSLSERQKWRTMWMKNSTPMPIDMTRLTSEMASEGEGFLVYYLRHVKIFMLLRRQKQIDHQKPP